MPALGVLNLGKNVFSSNIPHSLGSLNNLITLHLNDNSLSGELPSTLRNCTMLQLVNVAGNKLSGNIPKWIGTSYRIMMFLILRDNNFSGNIPVELCNAINMQLLDLSRNNISGKIPRCFNKFVLLAHWKWPSVDNIPIFVSGHGTFSIFVHQHIQTAFNDYAIVQWKGQDSEYRNNLRFLKLIDLSSNRLVGSIPPELSLLKGLASLNLSRNCLTGNIDPNIGQMEMLESLHLSRNRFDGDIPSGMDQLHYLQVLDLSRNNLSGKIPTSTQLQSFNASAYAENNHLCGPPLEPCLGDGSYPSAKTPGGQRESEEKENGFMKLSLAQDLGISMAFGFIFGFWGIVGPLLLKRSWRIAYFRFFGHIGDWLYVKAILIFAKFRQR